MNPEKDNSFLSNRTQVIVLWLLATTSIFAFYNYRLPLLQWPSVDNFPGLIHFLDPELLSNDFFAVSSAGITGRYPYLLLLAAVTKLASNGIFGGFAILQMLQVLLLPVGFFGVITQCLINNDPLSGSKKNQCATSKYFIYGSISFFIIISISLYPYFLCVAGWTGILMQVTAYTTSSIFVFLSFIALRANVKWLSLLLLMTAIVLHPVMSLMTLAFIVVLLFDYTVFKKNIKIIVAVFIIIVSLLLVVDLLLNSGPKISTDLFIQIYVRMRHPHHYLPQAFDLTNFYIVSVVLLGNMVLLRLLKNPLYINALIGFGFYVSALIIQYIGIEIIPMKTVAIFGAPRFFTFGSWMALLFTAISICSLLSYINVPVDLSKFKNAIKTVQPISKIILCLLNIFLFCLIIVMAVKFITKEHGFNHLDEESRKIFTLAQQVSAKDDVFFISRSFPGRLYFQIAAKRAVFFTEAFPFREDYFQEFSNRASLAGGIFTHTDTSRSLEDFLKMSERYRIDFVIMDKPTGDIYANCKPVAETNHFGIFSMKQLRFCSENSLK